jgi:succinate dehydrogenase / fumarate reductase cytochrome b subunit
VAVKYYNQRSVNNTGLHAPVVLFLTSIKDNHHYLFHQLACMDNNKKRTVYLNLFHFRFPATAIASIAHRISGILLFLSIPFFLYLLELSLASPMGFALACAWLDSLPVYLLLLVLLWALVHHLLAGLRFLLLDVDIGIEFAAARRSAIFVIVLALLVFLLGLMGL